ncbi:MAG: iron-sulfur cluster repair di-iron protein [Acidobacteria bacterium]|nr:iron-sulfur cluster repair di-iron protein [Acidobacteriota bacterium]
MNHPISPKDTLGALVARHPGLGVCLERLGLDYCCGGARTLEDAARSAGLDPASVIRALEAAVAQAPLESGEEKDWKASSLTTLADHIEAVHHAYLRQALPRLTDLLGKVRRAHEARHGAMLARLEETFTRLRNELGTHLMKEERVLFPLIRDLERFARGEIAEFHAHCGSVRNPIRQMEHEHVEAGEALATMRELTVDYGPPPDGCPTFRALYDELLRLETDLHRHIHLENNVLFPGAVALEQQGPAPRVP